ncbi:MAG: hypothetical protein AAGI46_10015 [Planctomycetota bacterium]
MIKARRAERNKLVAERKKLETKLVKIDRQIAAFDGSNGSTSVGGSRPRNDKPLPDVIHEVLKKNGKAMKVGAIADGVEAAGYLSSSANFKGIVNQALIKDKRFKQESRGMYKVGR